MLDGGSAKLTILALDIVCYAVRARQLQPAAAAAQFQIEVRAVDLAAQPAVEGVFHRHGRQVRGQGLGISAAELALNRI